LFDEDIYVIEVNPRASRTVPYISKVTGIPMCEVATKTSIGTTLKELGYSSGIAPVPPYVAAKVPVFSFEKLVGLDTHLGPEMKSTGEVLGIGKNPAEAVFKGLVAAGYKISEGKRNGVFLTVRENDRPEIVGIAEKFRTLGYSLYATKGTARILSEAGFDVTPVNKIRENDTENTATLLDSGKIDCIVSTSEKGRNPLMDDVKIRRKACMLGIPCLTSIDTANALADSLLSGYSEQNTELVDINNMRKTRTNLAFTKMQATGNDYIFFNCFDENVFAHTQLPESLAFSLAERRFSVGGDGIVLMLPSTVADAKMRIFNLDGSEGAMCGNAIRCVAKYLYDNQIVRKNTMKIETQSGIKALELTTKNGLVYSVKVDMGQPSVVAKSAEIGGKNYDITCVSMGNPNAVVFCKGVNTLNLAEIGPLFEHSPLFPERVNTEFVEVMGRNRLKMRVWERGNGETFGCGSGACASAVAAVLNGHCDKNADIKVLLHGGEQLTIRYTGETVFMTGAAEKAFDGVVTI
jgi:carbamoyl-phosphate synthase large subunit